MKVLTCNNIEFTIDIGTNRFNSLAKFFGADEETNELKSCQYNEDTGIATFSVKMLPFIYDYFVSQKMNTKCLNEVAEFLNFKVPIDTTKQNIQGFGKTVQRVNDKVITLKDEQYDFIKKVCKRPYGLISLYTGLGKGMLISYLAANYTGDGNVCIIVPNLSVKAELEERINVCGFGYTYKVKCIHPAGFLNSTESNSKAMKDWFAKVDMILMDEGENVSSSLYTIIRKYCKNVRMFYSFCGTSDRFNNWELSYKNLSGHRLSELHNETCQLIYYFGTVLVHRTLPKELNIYLTYLPLPREEKLMPWQEKQAVPKAVDKVFHSNAFTKYLDYIESNFGDKVLYCPVKTIAQGEYLLDYCNEKGYKAVFWQSGKITSTDNIKDLNIKYYVKPSKLSREDKKKKFTTLKEEANKHNVQIIFGTSTTYRGIDIKAITDVLLIIGASSSIVEQCAGRATRSDEQIRIWMLSNENDRYVDWQKHPNELSTPVWDGLQGAKFKHLSKLNIKYKEINLKYPIDQQPEKDSPKQQVEVNDEQVISKRYQHMDSAQRAHEDILKNLMRRAYKPKEVTNNDKQDS